MKLKNLLPLILCLALSPAFAQLKVNSYGKVGVAGATPYNNYGLRVNGSVYGSALYTTGTIGSSIAGLNSGSLKIYGSSGETLYNVLLTAAPGSLNLNGANLMNVSDERLKKDKKAIESPLAKLSLISGHSYSFKSNAELATMDLGGKRKYKMDTVMVGDSLHVVDERKQKFAFPKGMQYGFMAQEVQKALPELVSYDSASGVLGVNYLGFIPLLVEANKELVAKQSELEDRLAALEKELEKLTKKASSAARSAETDAVIETAEADLLQNNPNPFDQQTEIRFSLPRNVADARLFIYNLQGTQVRSMVINARGNAAITVQSGELEAGMYLYTLIADGVEVGTKKMILTR